MAFILQGWGEIDNPQTYRLMCDHDALENANGHIPFMFDLTTPHWYEGGAAINGASILSLTERAPGELLVGAGASAPFAGGGFDFSSLASGPAGPCSVVGPAGCLSALQAAQQYLVVGWFKIPALDKFPSAGVAPLFCTSAGASGYQAEADMLTIGLAGSPTLTLRRQTAMPNATAILNVSMPDLEKFAGQICQVGAWRTATETGLRLKSALGERVVTAAAGDLNTADFSATRPRWGLPLSFNNGSATWSSRTGRKVYAGFIENLAGSGRNPIDVLDIDWNFYTSLAPAPMS